MTEKELKLAERRAAELEEIRLAAGGMLKPEDVVKYARRKDTALHSVFTWDNTKAAEQYRIWQARMVIRVCVRMDPKLHEEIRTYVSLREYRGSDETDGYQRLDDVMADFTLRTSLLEQALEELQLWQKKYAQLTKLKPIFEAADKVRTRARKKQEPIRVVTTKKKEGEEREAEADTGGIGVTRLDVTRLDVTGRDVTGRDGTRRDTAGGT